MNINTWNQIKQDYSLTNNMTITEALKEINSINTYRQMCHKRKTCIYYSEFTSYEEGMQNNCEALDLDNFSCPSSCPHYINLEKLYITTVLLSDDFMDSIYTDRPIQTAHELRELFQLEPDPMDLNPIIAWGSTPALLIPKDNYYHTLALANYYN